jgi:hypothetical protein
METAVYELSDELTRPNDNFQELALHAASNKGED